MFSMMAAPFYSSRSVEVPGSAVPYQLLLMCVLSTVAFQVDTGTLLLESVLHFHSLGWMTDSIQFKNHFVFDLLKTVIRIILLATVIFENSYFRLDLLPPLRCGLLRLGVIYEKLI